MKKILKGILAFILLYIAVLLAGKVITNDSWTESLIMTSCITGVLLMCIIIAFLIVSIIDD